MAKIIIRELNVRTIIGVKDWEREKKQDTIINAEIEYEAKKALSSDKIQDTLDYKEITKKIIQEVESTKYHLLEKLADHVLRLILAEPLVKSATVSIDKPAAIQYSKSVAIEMSGEK
jgi:D-erythro-7,8-dihydroneopterin triphosphate epimerase